MDPLWIAGLAIVCVIVAVLLLRLHAFVALLLGGMLVAYLTPSEQIAETELRSQAVRVTQIDSDGAVNFANESALVAAEYLVLRESQTQPPPDPRGDASAVIGQLVQVDSVRIVRDENNVLQTDATKLAAGDLLVHPLHWKAARQVASPAERLANGFGDTCGKIGILIAMASIIGGCLLASGSAECIVNATRRLFGDRQTPVAFTVSGFVVGIPVFFDTVFYLLMPLARSMRVRTGRNYLLYVMSIVVGATMAHSLVPPTPGPLFVASKMQVDVGTMILGGLIVGALSAASGFCYVLWANRVWHIPLRDTTTGEIVDDDNAQQEVSRVDAIQDSDQRSMPPLWLSLMPIVLPVVLLAGRTMIDAALEKIDDPATLDNAAWTTLAKWMLLLGEKNIALMIAAAVAIGTLVWQQSRLSSRSAETASALAKTLQQSLSAAGIVILITAAGGAFGHVLRQSGVAEALQQRFPQTESGVSLLCVAFAVTAVVRFAQGSATVAMITAVGIVAPIASQATLPYHPVYLALAIGCGSKPLPWMNDSGFWVVGRMSGMTESETLRTFSVTLTVMGVVGFAITLAGAVWLPLLTVTNS